MAKFYIGIDIGDGETSVAWLTDEAVEAKMANLGYKNHSILSAYGFNREGRIVIGENVILEPGVEKQTPRFKSRYLTDTAAGTDVVNFARGLADALADFSGLMGAADERRIIVGCPTGAGWTQEKRASYAAQIAQALPVCAQPVGESRAAFLYTRYSGDIHIPRELLDKNVLVIDMGSSTTDLAYVVGGREKLGVFGAEFLGGGLLDGLILDACVDKHERAEDIRAYFERTPAIRNKCEVKARRVKEKYFTALADGEHSAPFDYEKLYPGRTHADSTKLRICTDDDMMGRLLDAPIEKLGGRSFAGALLDLLSDAQEKTKENLPDLVILTGGASRMPFVNEAVRCAFPDAEVACCQQPEYSIARGLAFACRVDARMEAFRHDIDAYTASPAFADQLDMATPALVTALAEGFAPLFVDMLFEGEKVNKWQNAAGEEEEYLSALEERFFEDAQTRAVFSAALKTWTARNFDGMTEQIGEICDKYRISRTQLPVPQGDQLSVQLPAFRLMTIVRLLGKIPGLGALIKKNYIARAAAEMKRLMLDRSGEFYTGLRSALRKGLCAEIDRRAREVEIPIL